MWHVCRMMPAVMKIALAAFVVLALFGCGGTGVPSADSQTVVGKWLLDPGSGGITPPPVPATVEFRADGSYTNLSAGSQVDSTYEVKDGVLTTEGGIGADLKKRFVLQNDNAGTLQLTEIGPPPTNSYFWRSIN